METLLGYLSVLAAPITAIIKLIEQDSHTEAEEQEVLYAIQRAVFNARAVKKFPKPEDP